MFKKKLRIVRKGGIFRFADSWTSPMWSRGRFLSKAGKYICFSADGSSDCAIFVNGSDIVFVADV